ncbi:hypothetical protein EHS25_005307 [Saitozyma podzolica]|uniref:Allantoate permease n=1 Tax=Saitozyma podzolica TaxID=1890683 RepID=A0A427XZ23_9TREE|nr:hypothetical protein EHS25_005307 [Saitozyma podzolica]
MSIPPELSAVPAADTQTKVLLATQHLEHVLTANDDDMLNEKQRHLGNHQLDDAKAILNQAGESIEISPEENKRLLRRIDWWVCAPMCIVYCVQSLDKSSLGHAAIFDLQKLTHLVKSQYSWLSSLVPMPSSRSTSTEPPQLRIRGAARRAAAVGVCPRRLPGQVLGHVQHDLLEHRHDLHRGCQEFHWAFDLPHPTWMFRGDNPTFVCAHHTNVVDTPGAVLQDNRVSDFAQCSERLCIYPYQGIFLYLGAISLGCAPLVWYLLPNSPTTAKFLRHGNDRLIALERVRENNTGTKTSKWKWPQFWEAMRDIKTWMWTAMFMWLRVLPVEWLRTFGGLITKGFGFDSFKTQLMQIPIGIIGIIKLLAAIWVANKIKNRYIVIVILSLPPIGACCALVYMSRSNIGGLMACYYVTHTYPCLQPLLYAWANLNASGTTKRVIVIAVLFIGQCAGNVVGPQVYFDSEAPYYRTGLYVDIGCWSVLVLLCIAMFFHLRRLNRRQAIRRRELGLPEDLKDISIMTIDEAAAYRAELSVVMREQGINRDIVFENAFDDMTDFE